MQVGFKLDGSKLTQSKIGSIRIFKHREVEGKIKTCTIMKDNLGYWYAIMVSEVEDVSPIEPKTAIGVDVHAWGKLIQFAQSKKTLADRTHE